MKLRAAVIGVGYLGRFHAQKYKSLADVELVAVCDGRFEQAQTVANELSVEAVRDPRSLIGKVDLVTVAASTAAHYELGKIFLEAGIPLNLEKPLAATYDQARELVELAEKNKTLLCTGQIERFNPTVRAAKDAMKEPVFMDLIRHTPFRARGADVSVLHDLMIHDLDLALWLANSKVKSVRATGTTVISGSIDAAEVFLEFENGVQARLSASRVSSKPMRSLRIVERNQVIQADTGSLEIDLLKPVSKDAAEPMTLEKKTVEKADALLEETKAFVAAVRGAAPVVTGRDGLRALEVVGLIEKALSASGSAV